jgi:hypothetical protein
VPPTPATRPTVPTTAPRVPTTIAPTTTTTTLAPTTTTTVPGSPEPLADSVSEIFEEPGLTDWIWSWHRHSQLTLTGHELDVQGTPADLQWMPQEIFEPDTEYRMSFRVRTVGQPAPLWLLYQAWDSSWAPVQYLEQRPIVNSEWTTVTLTFRTAETARYEAFAIELQSGDLVVDDLTLTKLD